MRAVFTTAILLFGLTVSLAQDADAAVDQYCAGTPAEAVMTLPAPLDQWAELYCTEYGHVIAARDGWAWTLPGNYAPVFVPAQTGTDYPARLGNISYFTRIDMVATDARSAAPALAVFNHFYPGDAPPRALYRLDVTSVSTGTHQIYFLDDGDESRWGIWCIPAGCDPKSMFMLLPPK